MFDAGKLNFKGNQCNLLLLLLLINSVCVVTTLGPIKVHGIGPLDSTVKFGPIESYCKLHGTRCHQHAFNIGPSDVTVNSRQPTLQNREGMAL